MAIAPASSLHLPVLEPGDHLSGEEFDRRYEQRHDIHKAELVGGVVYMPSPVRIPEHGNPVSVINHWLTPYAFAREGIQVTNDGTLILGENDRVQPDVMMWTEGSGRARLNADGYLEGAPEFVVEVAASSAAYDLHAKMRSYERAGVHEYVVWRTVDGAIDWFELRDGTYRRVEPFADGFTESVVYPGLKMHVEGVLSGERARLEKSLGR
jgi:Uma2 family endonuclease